MEKASHQRGAVSRFLRRAGGSLKTGFAVVGVLAAAGLYSESRKLSSVSDNENDEKKKKVLVIPFHRLQLVDYKKNSLRAQLDAVGSGGDKHERPIKLEVRELVDLLHQAAADPSIVALYGYFGHGSIFANTGWADCEEIRNALR